MCPPGRRATTIRPPDNQSPVWVAHHMPVFSRTSSAANAQAVQVSAMSEPACRPPHSRPACSRSRFKPVSQSAHRADQDDRTRSVGASPTHSKGSGAGL
jgi:hypothetical protein